MSTANRIKLRATDVATGNEYVFLISPTTPLTKLMKQFCSRAGCEMSKTCFRVEGVRIEPSDTAEKLKLNDNSHMKVTRCNDVGYVQARDRSLWENREFTDCEAVSKEGDTFNVHRCILSAGSEVLRRMLRSSMEEAATCKITFQETTTADLDAFLQYLYTGACPPSSRAQSWSLSGLIHLSDMYATPDLLQAVLDIAIESVRVDNVADIARSMNKRKHIESVADAYRALKKRVAENQDLQDSVLDSL
eukprot:TRINITY_DN67096_c0_g1_i1.p1 TRINITY_DN67096_c0_g1~~TRINITY_DN67096_c0_g1_i1.p1  ORF type:complete len:248 (-),score=26.75 TRINITY_DN67096_c0_g1_i1:187-930(-)